MSSPAVPVTAVAVAQPAVVQPTMVQPVVVPVAPAIVLSNLPPILATMQSVVVKQRVSLAEAVTQGCIEVSNTYDIMDAATGQKIFVVQEQSEDCARCCCAPNHPFSLTFNLVNPDGSPGPCVMTLERDGFRCPCHKCLGCWACNENCQDGFKLHEGMVMGDPGKDRT